MRESLKCLGFTGSRFSARNCATFASMAGSHGAVDSAGMSQSTTPGIDGGLKSSRIRVSSWNSEELEAEDKSFKDSSGVCDGVSDRDRSATMSSDRCARGWLLVGAGRRMMTWDFGNSRVSEDEAEIPFSGLSYSQTETQPATRETI